MVRISLDIDDRAFQVLCRLSGTQSKPIEQVAAEIIESEAIRHLPGGQANMHFGHRHPLDLGSVEIGMYEQSDGSFVFRN